MEGPYASLQLPYNNNFYIVFWFNTDHNSMGIAVRARNRSQPIQNKMNSAYQSLKKLKNSDAEKNASLSQEDRQFILQNFIVTNFENSDKEYLQMAFSDSATVERVKSLVKSKVAAFNGENYVIVNNCILSDHIALNKAAFNS